MALTFRSSDARTHPTLIGPIYAWAGFAIMWAFWVSFVIFLANPYWAPTHWPLPTVDSGSTVDSPIIAAAIDMFLVSLFGLQHSIMARPWFKSSVMAHMPPAFERATFVHAANLALFALVVFWQPIPYELWNVPSPFREMTWTVFAAGWIILFLGAYSFGILELLGIEQMRAWSRGLPIPTARLKTGLVYKWIPHPMYVGVLLAMWATPRMTVGHFLLAMAMSVYVLIGMRYEERDLSSKFGKAYTRWRGLNRVEQQ